MNLKATNRPRRAARAAALGLAALGAVLALGAQDILTADQFFLQLSDRYAQVNDYEGRIAIAAGKATMGGTIAYKAPNLLRINFVQPPDQVLVYDGQRLVVYLPPPLNAVLQQEVGARSAAGLPGGGSTGPGLATREGLRMMRRNYTIAWETSPSPVPLEGAPGEEVLRLNLSRKTASDGFRTLKLSVSPETKLIRRIEGWTISNEKFVFDFTGVELNKGIPETRFLYDSPASANVYFNFLFGDEKQ